ncbi:MAG TPA: alkaline phosphatase family protein [Thermoleophilaceae bacterium]|nr:alkaline phosphatase family protein [Thermoleophilaceae bacterium]
MRRGRGSRARAATGGVALLAAAILAAGAGEARPATTGGGIHKIKHVVMVMQENRSFDSYFGTYPGADGIPMDSGGKPTVCNPDPEAEVCWAPYHDPRDRTGDAPHGSKNHKRDVNGGKMDGFVREARNAPHRCQYAHDYVCAPAAALDVMGYHDRRELPIYWDYADNFVLHDRMFAPIASWSLPAHLYMVSAWSARCKIANDPFSCHNEISGPSKPYDFSTREGIQKTHFAWTDLTHMLHRFGVSWRYYVFRGREPDCAHDEALSCDKNTLDAGTPSIWNPLPAFDTVKKNKQVGNVQSISRFYRAANKGTLPSVSWVIPNEKVSEHPPFRVSVGQAFVASVVNAIMRGPNWKDTAIFVSYDDWGGYYDHVVPPKADKNGYGIRVPSLLISPYAKKGYVDHQTLSFDAYLKFIEDIFLSGQRLDPATMDRPDPRISVRENAEMLGDLRQDFDFSQKPRPPHLLNPHMKPPE